MPVGVVISFSCSWLNNSVNRISTIRRYATENEPSVIFKKPVYEDMDEYFLAAGIGTPVRFFIPREEVSWPDIQKLFYRALKHHLFIVAASSVHPIQFSPDPPGDEELELCYNMELKPVSRTEEIKTVVFEFGEHNIKLLRNTFP